MTCDATNLHRLIPEHARVALFVAHPDDEAVSAGALLCLLRHPEIVCITDGAPRNLHDALAAGFANLEDYAEGRRNECSIALSGIGIPRERVHWLGFADQQSSFAMANLARSVLKAIETIAPAIVLTHPYEGGHPDHDSTAFSVHAATACLRAKGKESPGVLEFTSYHIRAGNLVTFEFLTYANEQVTLRLSPEEQQRKRDMLACYRTQRAVLSQFPIDVERVRPAPKYRFTQPPHPGRLHYEHYDWGITGARWRALANQALLELGIAEPL